LNKFVVVLSSVVNNVAHSQPHQTVAAKRLTIGLLIGFKYDVLYDAHCLLRTLTDYRRNNNEKDDGLHVLFSGGAASNQCASLEAFISDRDSGS